MTRLYRIRPAHWLYWGWLALMPFIFMWFTRGAKEAAVPDEETAAKVLAEEDPALHAPGNAVTAGSTGWPSNPVCSCRCGR